MYDPKEQVEEERRYGEQLMDENPVTKEEHMQDIARLNVSAGEKARRFADDMPIDAILNE